MAGKAVPVRIQTPGYDIMAPFVEWPLDEMQALLQVIKGWGVIDDSGSQLDHGSVACDIVADEAGVYFRISFEDVE